MYMDDIKLFAKNEKESVILKQTVIIHNQDIGIEFTIERCATVRKKSEKRQLTKGIELPSQKRIRMLVETKETYHYLGIL